MFVVLIPTQDGFLVTAEGTVFGSKSSAYRWIKDQHAIADKFGYAGHHYTIKELT